MIMLHEVAPSGPVLSLFSYFFFFYSFLDLLHVALNRMRRRKKKVLKDAGFFGRGDGLELIQEAVNFFFLKITRRL